MRILVTGATGYIGGRLVPRLLEAGHEVAVLVRDPRRLRDRPWSDRVEVLQGDLEQPLPPLDADLAYYLVHGMHGRGDLYERERVSARHFVEAADGIGRIVYLGVLQPRTGRASPHLASRAEAGRILAAGRPTLELRSGPVVGSGSASFEMIRYLVERLPVITAPRGVDNEVTPIAVRDVLAYLVAAIAQDATGVVELGGPPLTFRDLILEYAEERGLSRRILTVPTFAPGLAGRVFGVVSPVSADLAAPLLHGMRTPLVADPARASALFPDIAPMPYRQAVRLALLRLEESDVETHFSGALGAAGAYELTEEEGLVREVRSRQVAAPPDVVFRAVCALGGDQGWRAWDWAWRLRGDLDALIGGPGRRRGRRHPEVLRVGDALDFWRVEEIEPPRLLRLRAEMRVPGRAWLQYECQPDEDGETRLVQTALYEPHGLAGEAYWWALYPAHRAIFGLLCDAIAQEAEESLAPA